MTLVRWKPARNLISFPYEIDRFFNDFGLDYGHSDTVWSPSVDVSETEKNYEVKAEMDEAQSATRCGAKLRSLPKVDALCPQGIEETIGFIHALQR